MRRLIPLPLLLLAAPTSVHAATVGREGTELVYRSAPGQEDLFEAEHGGGALTFAGREGGNARITPAAGCTREREVVRCPTDGLSAIRVLAGDSDDLIAMYGLPVPAIVDLGPGSDDFDGDAPALDLAAGGGSDRVGVVTRTGRIDLGPGEDYAQATIGKAFTGPLAVEGGEGRDLLFVDGQRKAGISLSGGNGPDDLIVQLGTDGPGLDIACGAGDDATQLALVDRPGDGCAAHVTFPAPPAFVSRAFGGATLTAPASGAVEFRRNPGPNGRRAPLLARGTFDASAGPLRTRLKTTKAGRRYIRRDPDLKLFVTVKTRTGGDRSEIDFGARLR
ncbi:hypothetical protein C8N24_6047 [Solirubrobacter pauli]|uniref:Hemolysin type calcium-binding protein n=1 Tax=Solirubrobacter pauli TaxID=166793 RepID=A0A660L1Z3_9ACTN|nr:hypothetical protein [Solirubrobacter pauli]RKQ88011.1 hypothetical protein C8N24_6047 [Solirubrobacter pauli]